MSSFDKCTADTSVGPGRGKNRMHLNSLAKNISSNKRYVFCSIYLSVIRDLRKTHSLHITKRKSLLIDICDHSTHPKTLTTSYEGSLSESSVAVQMQVLRKTITTSYQESVSESSVAVQMQSGCKPHLDSKLSADAHSSLNIAH